ncbi:hypothetical protein TNCT_575431 [Trichonephila clavata]|uniref:C2H2-type domain-containing protein n=1 Tax=Trichonephila clavata TaxID=2740835 RepID=A0A8X6I7S3_TRICU|nr:hypothetical protein TNCT_575431 [Trichonephila clavata]
MTMAVVPTLNITTQPPHLSEQCRIYFMDSSKCVGYLWKCKLDERSFSNEKEKCLISSFLIDCENLEQQVPNRKIFHLGGERPFVCKHCGKAYAQKDKLTVHIRSHTGERPFVCKHCGKAFARNDKLTAHIRIHTGERPYICSHCSKSFTTKGKLNIHLRTHESKIPYVCTQCGKNFNSKEKLSAHLLIHLGGGSCASLIVQPLMGKNIPV